MSKIKELLKPFMGEGESFIEKAQRGDGVMISLGVPPEVAATLGDRETPPEEMHVTLVYLGRVNELPDGAVKKAARIVREVAERWAPLVGRLGGVGVFAPSPQSDEKYPEYVTYSSVWLPELRQEIVDMLRADGVPFKNSHGFVPHITMAYHDQMPEKLVQPSFREEYVTPGLRINVGDVCMEVPFTGEDAEDEIVDVLTESDAGALTILGLVDIAKEDDSEQTVNVALLLNQPDRRLTYGVVLEPYTIDLQDMVLSESDVEFAAHHFMAVRGIMGLRHRRPVSAVVVESYIAPCDFTLGSQLVKKGSWVLVTRVDDEETWQKIVSGELTGYSVGGFGIRRPLA